MVSEESLWQDIDGFKQDSSENYQPKYAWQNGGRAHYIVQSKAKWKPFWLAAQQNSQNDWLGGNFSYSMTYAHGLH